MEHSLREKDYFPGGVGSWPGSIEHLCLSLRVHRACSAFSGRCQDLNERQDWVQEPGKAMATAPWGRRPASPCSQAGRKAGLGSLRQPWPDRQSLRTHTPGIWCQSLPVKVYPQKWHSSASGPNYHAVDYVSTWIVHLRPCNRMTQIKKTIPEKKAWEYLISTKILRKSSCLRHESESIGCSFIWNNAII